MGHLATGRIVAGLNGTYHIDRALSKNGLFVATRDGERVLLKEVQIGDADAWSRIEALVRDARISKHLTHPRIAAFLELFVVDGDAARAPEALSRAAPQDAGNEAKVPSMVLARKFVEGCSIADAVRDGRRFVAADIERMLRGLLEARRYLDDLLPEVVHGDISPANVILGADGHPCLIDFGTAAEPQEDPMIAAGAEAIGGAQARRAAGPWTPAADLHAIAMTVLAAASHLTPAQMPRLDSNGTVDVVRTAPLLSYPVEQALRACFNADASRPPHTAAEVLRRLDERWPKARRAALTVGEKLRARKARMPLALGLAVLTGAAAVAAQPWRSGEADALTEPTEFTQIGEVKEPSATGETTTGETTSGETTAGETTATETEPAETPSTEPASVTTSLEWPGALERASGDLKAGESCVLRLDATIVGDSAACSVHLTCGDQILLDGESTADCRLNEIAAGDTYVYQAAFWIDSAGSVENVDAAMFGSAGRFYGSRTNSDGKKKESWRIKLSDRSLPRTGEPLLTTLRSAKEKVIHGTAVSSSGRHRVAKGQSCTFTVGPNTSADFLQDNGNGCQAKVECGRHVLYDGAGDCALDRSGEPHYEDTSPSAIDSDPRLVFDGKELTVADVEASGAWKVVIYLDEEPSPSGSEGE